MTVGWLTENKVSYVGASKFDGKPSVNALRINNSGRYSIVKGWATTSVWWPGLVA